MRVLAKEIEMLRYTQLAANLITLIFLLVTLFNLFQVQRALQELDTLYLDRIQKLERRVERLEPGRIEIPRPGQ